MTLEASDLVGQTVKILRFEKVENDSDWYERFEIETPEGVRFNICSVDSETYSSWFRIERA